MLAGNPLKYQRLNACFTQVTGEELLVMSFSVFP